MEYCSGGDLFSYLEQRNYMLKEKDACIIIYKLCKAIYYIHSYGIVHRDIKPENILMTSNEDNADIRLLDFGLGKILGPGEFCHEPFGTLSYVAPEVLCEQPYNKAVDLWSVGVTTYLLLCGFLPFDDPDDDTEIARKTINEPVRFKGIIWKGISKHAINFIQRLLDKNPETRMNITETLEHSWFSKMGVNHMSNNCNKGAKNSSLFKMYTFTNTEQLNDKKG
jgi:serine/threonine protein kinase